MPEVAPPKKVLVTGGISQTNARLLHGEHIQKAGEIALVDWQSGQVESLLTYVSPPERMPDELASCSFTAASVVGNLLYVCTRTELLIYEMGSLRLVMEISHPYFNDLHHAAKVGNEIYVANTGLDTVAIFDESGNFLRMQNVLGKDLWGRHSADTDYRKVVSTKPHESHPNYIFNIDGEPWVTRFNQRDAISLRDPSRRIDIGVERVHDGVVVGDFIYFTCVNGNIAIASADSLKVEEVIDLNDIDDRGVPLGWCRGICIYEQYAFVGFTKLRQTKFVENVVWLKHKIRPGKKFSPLDARVACYDLQSRSLVKEITMPEESQSAIFSIVGLD